MYLVGHDNIIYYNIINIYYIYIYIYICIYIYHKPWLVSVTWCKRNNNSKITKKTLNQFTKNEITQVTHT